jgi:hypothetical protein
MTWNFDYLKDCTVRCIELKVDIAGYNKSGCYLNQHSNQNTFIDIAVQGTRSRGGKFWY